MPDAESDIENLVLRYRLIAYGIGFVVLCALPATIAAWKGYAWQRWLFGGGVAGVIVLLALPSLRPGTASHLQALEKRRFGNRIGTYLSAFTIAGCALAALIKLSSMLRI